MHHFTKHTVLTVTSAILCIVLFCIPILLRRRVYHDTEISITSSDMVPVTERISSVWCSAQTLTSNSNVTFVAYLLPKSPDIMEDLQFYSFSSVSELRVSGVEYWGFYLLKGSKISISACGRLPGSTLTVVRGQKTLTDCMVAFIQKNLDNSEESEETIEDDQQESSISSSEGVLEDVEEGVFKCPEYTIYQREISTNFSCYSENKTSDYYTIEVLETDYYYIVFSGGAILDLIPSEIFWDLVLSRTSLDLRSTLRNCSSDEKVSCTMPLKFASSHMIVANLVAENNSMVPQSTIILSTCEPRKGLFFMFYLLIFLVLFACAFQ